MQQHNVLVKLSLYKYMYVLIYNDPDEITFEYENFLLKCIIEIIIIIIVVIIITVIIMRLSNVMLDSGAV